MRISDWSSDVCSSDLILVRVQLRGVGRQEEQFDLLFAVANPGAHLFAVVYAQVVENQEHLAALSIANQATQEANQHWGCQRFPIQHEAQFAPIGDRKSVV